MGLGGHTGLLDLLSRVPTKDWTHPAAVEKAQLDPFQGAQELELLDPALLGLKEDTMAKLSQQFLPSCACCKDLLLRSAQTHRP